MYIYHGRLNLSGSNTAGNEGIDVVFPLAHRISDPVYSIWEWLGTADGTPKRDYFSGCSGTVDALTVTDAKNVGFDYDADDVFDGAFPDVEDYKNLGLAMRDRKHPNASGPTSGTASDLQPVYEFMKEEPALGIAITPRMYMGKLSNWGTDADNELFVVVVPSTMGKDSEVCAFWQWTKVNVDEVTTISDVQNVADVGQPFRFYQGNNNYYTFACTVYEKIEYNMTNPSDDSTGPLTLDLQEDFFEPERKRGALSDKTTSVHNDSSEIAICSLNAFGTGLTDGVLATVSFLLGGAGFLSGLAEGLSAAVGVYLAAVGWHVAVGGIVQDFN